MLCANTNTQMDYQENKSRREGLSMLAMEIASLRTEASTETNPQRLSEIVSELAMYAEDATNEAYMALCRIPLVNFPSVIMEASPSE